MLGGLSFSEPQERMYNDANCSGATFEICGTPSVHATYMYALTPICIAGAFLNCLNLVVFNWKTFRVKSCTLTFLVAIAVSDLGYLCLSAPMGSVRCLEARAPHWEWTARQLYEIVLLPVINWFGAMSVWLTVLVSVERYMHVQHIVVARNLFTIKLCKVYIAVIAVLSLAMHVPFMFTKTLSPGNEFAERSAFGVSHGYKVLVWVRLFVIKVIPITIIAIFNVLLILAIYESNRRRRAMVFPNTMQVRRLRMQQRLTRMLISLSLLLIACNVIEPFIHPGVYIAFNGPCSIYEPSYGLETVIVNALEAFSFAVNFVFYCIYHPQFTAALKQMLRIRSGKVRPQLHCDQLYVSRVFSVQQGLA